MMVPTDATPASTCAFCQSTIAAGEPTTSCPACTAPYHRDCWEENTGCAVYGCERVPVVEARDPLEMPLSYWGQEEKPCPNCRETIRAAALRCRHCGTVFGTAQPRSSEEFRRQQQAADKATSLRRGTVWLFVLCLLPPTAPFAALFGGLWYRARREAYAVASPLYSGLARLALGVGVGQTALIAVIAGMYALTRGA